jgi:hypothetical protein
MQNGDQIKVEACALEHHVIQTPNNAYLKLTVNGVPGNSSPAPLPESPAPASSPAAIPCIDSDGGQDFSVKGTVTGDSGAYKQFVLGLGETPWLSADSPYNYTVIHDFCMFNLDFNYQSIAEGFCAKDFRGNWHVGYIQTACPEGTVCMDGACVQKEMPPAPPGSQCEDGAAEGECSNEKPKACEGGELVDDAEKCGCPAGMIAAGTQCTSATTAKAPQAYCATSPVPAAASPGGAAPSEVAATPAKPAEPAQPQEQDSRLDRIIALLEQIRDILLKIIGK